MALVSRGAVVGAPRRVVWELLADLRSVAAWNPRVVSAEVGELDGGVGAVRSCDLGPDGRLDETVSVWDEGRELWFAIGGRGAIRSAEFGFVLSDDFVGTEVEAIADYHLALGPLGPVVDHITIRRHMARMLNDVLDGLKDHVEALQTKERDA